MFNRRTKILCVFPLWPFVVHDSNTHYNEFTLTREISIKSAGYSDCRKPKIEERKLQFLKTLTKLVTLSSGSGEPEVREVTKS